MNATAHTSADSTEQIWAWLAEVEDPEIPVISIVDLGIVRDVQWQGSGEMAECVVDMCNHRQHPIVFARKPKAFYRILLGHDDRIGIDDIEIGR